MYAAHAESQAVSATDRDETVATSEQWGEAPMLSRRKKTGGRKRGTPNKKNAQRAELIAGLKVSGKDPISFFISILRNESAPLDLRFAAAERLAPYTHPKLASIEARSGGKTHEDRLAELQAMHQRALTVIDEEGE